MRRAKTVTLLATNNNMTFAPGACPGPKPRTVVEVRAHIIGPQFASVRVTWDDNEITDIAYCGPLYIEWDKLADD